MCQTVQQSAPLGPKLTLTTHVIERRYCSHGWLLFTLEPEYKNTGDKDLILFKYALAPFQYRVSKSVEKALANRYEQVISPMMGSGPSTVQWGTDPPADFFVVLKPQQSYVPVNTITVGLSLAEFDKPSDKQYLASGEHVLQLNVATWPLEDNLAAEFRNRWQALGSLWTDSLLSLPMTFRIDDSRQRLVSDCSAPVKRSN